MSINAIIIRVKRLPDGMADLELGPYSKDPPGQKVLTVINPPPYLESVVGTHIWGSSGSIIVGETLWAKRIGCTMIRLVGEWPDAVDCTNP
jgi:hypothetical protein